MNPMWCRGVVVVGLAMWVTQAAAQTDDLNDLRRRATRGEMQAQNALGGIYDSGHGVPRDYVEAVRWFRLAADQGFPDAQVNLGFNALFGQGLPQNDQNAARWFRLAADQGHANAQAMLGDLYLLGRGLPQDVNAGVTGTKKTKRSSGGKKKGKSRIPMSG